MPGLLEVAETHQARRMTNIFGDEGSPTRTQGGCSGMWNKVDDVAHGEIKRKEVTVDDGLMPVCGVRVRAWTATTSNLRDASCDEPS